MGGFLAPKPPAPPILAPAPTKTNSEDVAMKEERSRRQKASGTSGNIISSLRDSVSDSKTSTSISKLLG